MGILFLQCGRTNGREFIALARTNKTPALQATVKSIDSDSYMYIILIRDVYSGGFKVRIVCGCYSVNLFTNAIVLSSKIKDLW